MVSARRGNGERPPAVTPARRRGKVKEKRGTNMNVAEAERNFAQLVEKVHREGVTIDLERDNQVIARLSPPEKRKTVTVGELAEFLRSLPPLGDDAESFAEDVRQARTGYPPEADPWD